MTDENKAVDAVKKEEPAVVPPAAGNAATDDLEATNRQLREELEKVRRDRDNYRTATLALKGKKELDELDLTDPVQAQAFIQKQNDDFRLQLLEEQAKNKLDEFQEKLIKENQELKRSLQNKGGAGVSGGASGTGMEVKQGYFSEEQKKDLEKRWEMMRIEKSKWPEMLKRAEDSAKSQFPGIA